MSGLFKPFTMDALCVIILVALYRLGMEAQFSKKKTLKKKKSNS